MFNVGPAELLIIGLVLLIAVGPEQLPGVIRRVGSAVGQLRSMTDGLRSEFMAGLDEIERSANPATWADDDGPKESGPRPGRSAPSIRPTSTMNGAAASAPVSPDPEPGPDDETNEPDGSGAQDRSEHAPPPADPATEPPPIDGSDGAAEVGDRDGAEAVDDVERGS